MHSSYFEKIKKRKNELKEIEKNLNAIYEFSKTNTHLTTYILVELVNVKEINDYYGYKLGNAYIDYFIDVMTHIIDHKGTLFRYDGMRFLLLCSETIHEELIETILRTFRDISVAGKSNMYQLKIGVAFYGKHSVSPEELIQFTKIAIKNAKINEFQRFECPMKRELYERVALKNKFTHALLQGKLMMYYQPQVTIQTGKVESVEALLRWYDEEYGFIAPDKILELAEELSLMPALNEWIFMTVANQLNELHQLGKTLKVAVNISPKYIDEHFKALLDDVLQLLETEPEQLEIEITEIHKAKNLDEMKKILEEIADQHISIALDDFGTGYSNIFYLKELGTIITQLKIDKTFSESINDCPVTQEILAAVIDLAHTLNIAIVVEGIETYEQLKTVTTMMANKVQGYYFSPALPLNELLAFLHSPLTLKK